MGVSDEVFDTSDGFENDISELGEDNSISEKYLVGKGNYLGLDISLNSTGICIYCDGKKNLFNAGIDVLEDDPHWEVKARRELKSYILEAVKSVAPAGVIFDSIVVEDVFEGENPLTTRRLYALNTSIDELLIDGEVHCKSFRRVNNRVWKGWLYSVDPSKEFKGLNDKTRIEKCLAKLGVVEAHSKGYQDRLDATGLVLAYLLNNKTIGADQGSEKKEYNANMRMVSLKDLEFAYSDDYNFSLSLLSGGIWSDSVVVPFDGKLSVDAIRFTISENVSDLSICLSTVRQKLGALGSKLGVGTIQDGGYLAWRITDKALGKYMKE